MVTIGIDAHKRSHTVVIVDEQGRQLAAKTVGTTSARPSRARCAGPLVSPKRRWAVEDCRHLSRRLERDLLAAGERIVRVPPKLMANVRDRGPHRSARATRSTRSLSPVPRCVSPTCRSPSSTGQSAKYGCLSTIAKTWSASEPA